MMAMIAPAAVAGENLLLMMAAASPQCVDTMDELYLLQCLGWMNDM
jgi:hypothetical protein